MADVSEHWGVVLADTHGQILRNPAGNLFLEVQVGEAWWSLPVPPSVSDELTEAIAAEASSV